MLYRILPENRLSVPSFPIADATFPNPFPHTLEYSPAARGTWNIVHTGMLVPEAHQIYICAAGCLRGVILTAAEMGDSYRRRFHTLELHERDLYATDPETFLIEGITEILRRLDALPPAVLVFTACVHHFLGCNLPFVYQTLRKRFPNVQFAECIMDPIRQTKGLPPEVRERREIYRLLQPPAQHDNAINILGSNLALDEESDIKELLRQAGRPLRDLTECPTYADFEQMGKSCANLYTNPFTKTAAEELQHRLGQPSLYLPQVWTYEEILRSRDQLATFLSSLPIASLTSIRKQNSFLHADVQTSHIASLKHRFHELQKQLQNHSIAIDSTFTFLPFSLARLLVSHNLNVAEIYADVIPADDEQNFYWLQKNAPHIQLYPTKHPAMRTQLRKHLGKNGREPLALGQKATYFTGTHHFLPAVEGGGHYGLEAIEWLLRSMQKAMRTPKNPEPILKRKAYGAPSCL